LQQSHPKAEAQPVPTVCTLAFQKSPCLKAWRENHHRANMHSYKLWSWLHIIWSRLRICLSNRNSLHIITCRKIGAQPIPTVRTLALQKSPCLKAWRENHHRANAHSYKLWSWLHIIWSRLRICLSQRTSLHIITCRKIGAQPVPTVRTLALQKSP